MRIQCEHPNSAIHHFNGTIFWSGREIAVDSWNFLLRGSTLRNTSWAVGVVVYTGRETKIAMNSRSAPSKLSSIERTMNNLIYLIFGAQCMLSTISVVVYIVWKSINYDKLTYLCYNYSDSTNVMYSHNCSSTTTYSDASYWFTFFILYCNFLPISIYMTIEMCNFVQAYYIDQDREMHDPVSDTCALSRTSNMNGDLGMIEYIFSDKTGTLTQNIMKFKLCSVNGVVYGDDDVSSSEVKIRGGPEDVLPLRALRDLTHINDSVYFDFLVNLAVGHTVVLDPETGHFQSESPDEDALIRAAYDLGFRFIRRTFEGVYIQHIRRDDSSALREQKGDKDDAVLFFEVIATIPFTSSRKRMSVVVRQPNGEVVVLCKGADNVILDRSVSFTSQGEVDGINEKTVDGDFHAAKSLLEQHLHTFASSGLRTLALARRVLSPDVLNDFLTVWREAESVVVGRSELVDAAAAIVENKLSVVGVTAIEDKLQDEVPETIADIAAAGIKLWVLTGDKVETAINIGYASKLLRSEMILIKLQDRGETILEIKYKLKKLLTMLKRLTDDEVEMSNIWKRLKTKMKLRPASADLSVEGDAKSISPSASSDDSSGAEESDIVHRPMSAPSLEDATSEHLAVIVIGIINLYNYFLSS